MKNKEMRDSIYVKNFKRQCLRKYIIFETVAKTF